ncbi:MAG: CorA family divalent cation transporter [Gemmatimonadaceae bacterium]
MSTATKTLLQDARPTADPKVYSCFQQPQKGVQENLSRDQIAKAVASGQGTLWVDLDTTNIAFFLGGNYLVTVHGEDTNPVKTTAELLHREPDLVGHGPARLMHAIVDQAVDAYFPVIDKLDEFMEAWKSGFWRGSSRIHFAMSSR